MHGFTPIAHWESARENLDKWIVCMRTPRDDVFENMSFRRTRVTWVAKLAALRAHYEFMIDQTREREHL